MRRWVRSGAARAAGAVFAITLAVYWATMNRTIGFIDRGELAAAAVTFGIPHPTGYPTLMMLAGLVVKLSPLRPVLTLNALAGLLTAAGAAVLCLWVDQMARGIPGRPVAAGDTDDTSGAIALSTAGDTNDATRSVLAACTALFTAFTTVWWQQANGFEVYALHVLLMPLVLLLFWRWISSDGKGSVAFAIVTGLAFTNHMTTVLLAPGMLVLTFMRFGVGSRLARRLLSLAPPFALGLLPYAWLPIRSAMNPRFDWGHIRSLRELLHHVSGADYQRWMFANPTAMAEQWRYVAWRVPLDFAWAGILVAALGAALLARRARGLAVMAGGIVITGAVFATGYGIPDLDAYLLTVVTGLAVCFMAGLIVVRERFGARVAIAIAAILVAANGVLHARECDERNNRMVEHFVHDCMAPLPQHAVLFTDLWENLVAGSEYFQEVEGVRRDVTVISPVLARKGWYLEELKRRAPDLVGGAGASFGAYAQAVRRSESGEGGSREQLESLRSACFEAMVAGAIRARPVFTTGALPNSSAAWHSVPWGMTLWLRSDSAYLAEPELPSTFEPWTNRMDVYLAITFQAYAKARMDRAGYELAHGRRERVASLMRAARSFDPRIRPQDVGPQPLGGDRTILRVAQYFRSLSEPADAAR